MHRLSRFFKEYLLLNLFIFSCVYLLSFFVLNLSFFDPFTEAFKDFSLTDLYYSKVKNKNDIYKGPVVLINIEDKERRELSFLLQQIREGKPKVTALDIIFPLRNNQQDSLLRYQFRQQDQYVFSYVADFENEKQNVYNDTFFTKQEAGYANLMGDNRESSTIRYYYPFTNDQEAFTSSILKIYNPSVYKKLLKRKNQKTEIHYSGNLANFTYYDFDEVMNPSFDASLLKDKIVLLGYLGLPKTNYVNRTDEDKFFTPLNSKLSGRSFPDMYGLVVHANIVRMLLENDFVKVIPKWLNMIISFLIIWLMLPLFCGLFFKGDLWFNGFGTGVQLVGSILLVFITVLVYRYFNIKFDPGLLMGCFVLLPTFINLYESFLKFLHYKLKIPFKSRFLDKDPND